MPPSRLEALPSEDLWIVCLHPAGGAKASLYQLWRGLRRQGIDAGLMTDLSGFEVPASDHVVDLEALRGVPVEQLVESLRASTFDALYLYNVYTLPYFRPLIEETNTFFHFECWRGELVELISLLHCALESGRVTVSETPDTVLSSHVVDSSTLPDLAETAYLQSYVDALARTDVIASLVPEDIPLVEQIAALAGWQGDRIEHVPPLIDTSLFPPQERPPAAEKRLLVNGQKTHAGNASRNLSVTTTLLDPNSPEWDLFVTGTTDDDSLVESTSRELLANCEPAEGFHRLPRVPYERVPELYRNANLYALLSVENEGFSVSTLEAMASGCVPVLSPFVVRRMDEGIRPGENCVVVGSEESFRPCVERLVADPSRLREMQEAAVDTIEQRYAISQRGRYPFFRDL